MFARVSRYKGDVTQLQAGFEAIYDELEGLDGFVQAYFLVDEENRRAMSVTLWATQEAREASEQVAHQMRTRETRPVDVTIESVSHFEVVETAKPGEVPA